MEFGIDNVSQTIYLPRQLDDKLRALAKSDKVTVNDLVVMAITRTLAEMQDLKDYMEGIEYENIA